MEAAQKNKGLLDGSAYEHRPFEVLQADFQEVTLHLLLASAHLPQEQLHGTSTCAGAKDEIEILVIVRALACIGP